ncbi:uncharacterized protein LAESUDRAFT_659197 [Laetiporus sulphureus 93-53]|uniref:DNA replication regulator Sld3 C-terminal domain-containing protein n=1 Tax=Laetiporus sulphureus 93-53 TaxID=1314785 RepID=A0A165CXZ8_9APHY|nr:uncharacterized protein LAESUDRAFT_659197 [Laetiporus sulphureus 93-53]KZT03710.1 hypothetical protein LAESUDRAFT_659197 [Laetiporus sulphureus 93-53]
MNRCLARQDSPTTHQLIHIIPLVNIASILMPNARYVLSVDCPVKWTAAQGRSVSNDYPFADIQASTSAEFVQRRYLDFLWLPESISPLRCLIPTLLRAADQTPSTSEKHPLHGLLQPILLTPRLASQKYHSRISQILEDDSGTGDVEENMIWFALKYEKADEEEAAAAQGDFDADDRWKHEWLARMERREVQIQILLHFLLLSLPGAPKPPVELTATELSPHLSSPKKRKRKRSASPPPRILSLEECLELFMDKMSMWQLMTSLETDDDKRNVQHSVNTKGKKKSLDERDWMQAFCEDVIEKQYVGRTCLVPLDRLI